jgi:hypothetical protein
MDEQHINGLKPQNKDMPKPVRSDGENQQQHMGQVADKIQLLIGMSPGNQDPLTIENGNQYKFQQENNQMAAEQKSAHRPGGQNPKRIVPQIGRRQKGKTKEKNGHKLIPHFSLPLSLV